MSKLSSLITSLVLSGSSIAAAAPSVEYRAPAPPPTSSPIFHRPAPQSQWTLLGSARLAGRASTVDVSSATRFQKLEIKARTGAMRISRVLITFRNGETQVVAVNDALSAGRPILIDLEGRRGKKIDKVTVFGRANARASFTVLAV